MMSQNRISATSSSSISSRAWRTGVTRSLVGIGLLGALCLLPVTPAQAQTTVNYSFEDNLLRGDPTTMKVPPKILTENGNHFMRITGSSSDKESIPASHPERNRSTVTFTSKYSSMPLLSSTTMRQTYSAKLRFHGNTGSDYQCPAEV